MNIFTCNIAMLTVSELLYIKVSLESVAAEAKASGVEVADVDDRLASVKDALRMRLRDEKVFALREYERKLEKLRERQISKDAEMLEAKIQQLRNSL